VPYSTYIDIFANGTIQTVLKQFYVIPNKNITVIVASIF